MRDDELLAIIAAHEKAAMGSSSAAGMTVAPNSPQNMTTLELDNYNALNYYYARPLGNEIPDRSQVVIPELRDTVEWIMPQLMRMFAGTDRLCRFEPEGEQDEALAEQQTDGVNYIFMRQNPGWMILHDYFKDALLLRNGYIKCYWEKRRRINLENYTGLDADALAKLFQDAEEEGDELEILGQEERRVLLPPAPGPLAAAPQMQTAYDIKLRRVSDVGQVCIECVPREEVLVSSRTRGSLDDSPYYCHKDVLPRSDLIARGFEKELVNAAQPGPPRWTNLDDLARNDLLDQTAADEGIDPAMQELEVRECYLRVDYDGDGLAELRRVIVIGDKVADNEEVEEGPLASGVPMRMPHRHTGISLYELLVDIQQIKTMLVRQGLDNVYLANNTRTAVDQDNVNFDDLLTNRPGGVVRTRGTPDDKILPLATPNVLPDILSAIEYVDGLRQWRTGVGADTTTLNADELQDVTKGNALALLSKSDLKIEMMARLLAEGLKDAFRKVNDLVIRHQDQSMLMKLRGRWVSVDPTLWRSRYSVSVNVGLGSGNREEQRANLLMLSQAMQQGAAMGIVGPKQAYNAAKKIAEALGFQQPDEFFIDPDSPAGQQLRQARQPPPHPQLQVAQFKAQADAQQRQQDHALELQRIQARSQAEAAKAQLDHQSDTLANAGDFQLKRAEVALDFIAQIVAAALKAQAPAASIQQDVASAAGAEAQAAAGAP